ncbi:unnamed protein product [Rhizophagus irregularis]|nr:unnamed protein product [Rhizophagus irregularis]CAB4434084.1 unnamed protein product [Rhizophagus irregularis]
MRTKTYLTSIDHASQRVKISVRLWNLETMQTVAIFTGELIIRNIIKKNNINKYSPPKFCYKYLKEIGGNSHNI